MTGASPTLVPCAGESDAGTGSGLGVGAMVLRPDRPRVYVGASAADDFLTALDVVDEAFVIPPGAGASRLSQGPSASITYAFRSIPSGLKDTPITWPTAARSTARGSFLEDGRGNFLYAFGARRLSPRGECRGRGTTRTGMRRKRPVHSCQLAARHRVLPGQPRGSATAGPRARHSQSPRFRLGTPGSTYRARHRGRRLAGRPEPTSPKIHQHWPASSRSC